MIKRHLVYKTTAVALAAAMMSAPAMADASRMHTQAQEATGDEVLTGEILDAADPALSDGEGHTGEGGTGGNAEGGEGNPGGETGLPEGSAGNSTDTGGSGAGGDAVTGDTSGEGAGETGNAEDGTSRNGGAAQNSGAGEPGITTPAAGAETVPSDSSSGNSGVTNENTAEQTVPANTGTETVTSSETETNTENTASAVPEKGENSEEELTRKPEEAGNEDTGTQEEATEDDANEDPEAADETPEEALSPEQEDALAEEEAEQEAQSGFDEFESYDPGLFSYTTDWRGWKQGSSAWYSMRNYGCRMVAYSKLLRATGIENPGHFSPDAFFRWCRSNGWLAGTIREIGTPGNCAIAYAEAKGRTLIREEAISMFKSSDPEERKQEIIDKINEGYYVILCSSAHFVYVDEVKTRLTQELWVDDSINGENVYKVDRHVFQGSLKDSENADSRKNWHYRYFSVDQSDEIAEPLHVTDVRLHSINREEGYYTLDATVSSDAAEIDRVVFPTWTAKDDRDDLPDDWEYGTASEGYLVPSLSGESESVYRFRVRMGDHNNEAGKYFTYVYAYGRDGQRSAPGTIKVNVRH